MIYVGRRYTSTMKGTKVKAAQCVNCRCVYAYVQNNVATGVGVSPYYLDNSGAEKRAGASAERQLTAKLNADGPAACPTCGWIQPAMLRVMRKQRSSVLGVIVILACGAAAIGLLSDAAHPVTILLCIAAVSLTGLWWVLRSNFNPNARPHERVGKDTPGLPQTDVFETLAAKYPDPGVLSNLTAALEEHKTRAAKAPLDWEAHAAPRDVATLEAEDAQRRSMFKMRLAGVIGVTLLLAAASPFIIEAAQDEKDYQATLRYAGTYEKDRYLSRFPHGRHAEEVRKMLVESMPVMPRKK